MLHGKISQSTLSLQLENTYLRTGPVGEFLTYMRLSRLLKNSLLLKNTLLLSTGKTHFLGFFGHLNGSQLKCNDLLFSLSVEQYNKYWIKTKCTTIVDCTKILKKLFELRNSVVTTISAF